MDTARSYLEYYRIYKISRKNNWSGEHCNQNLDDYASLY